MPMADALISPVVGGNIMAASAGKIINFSIAATCSICNRVY